MYCSSDPGPETTGSTHPNKTPADNNETKIIFGAIVDNVEEVINYFREIGILEIDNLLILDITIFTKDIDYVKDIFNATDINETVKLINKDITYITKL